MNENEIKELFGIKNYPKRTNLQNDSLHLYFALLSEAFNDAGYTIKDVIQIINMGLLWTPISVKEALWRPLQVNMLGKQSTTQLNTVDITTICEPLRIVLNDRLKIDIPFPSTEQTVAYKKSLIEQSKQFAKGC